MLERVKKRGKVNNRVSERHTNEKIIKGKGERGLKEIGAKIIKKIYIYILACYHLLCTFIK